MMAIKTNGATIKRYLDDDSVWHKEGYYEDATILINGTQADDGLYIDKISDEDQILINGGVVIDGEKQISLSRHFNAWMKKQNTVSFIVSCDKAKLESLKAVITFSGGKV